jgi:hypothetical protein
MLPSSSLPSLSQGQDSVSEGDSGAEEVTHASGNQFTNQYLNKILESAELHILQPSEVATVVEGDNPELVLFNLFMMKTFLNTVRRSTQCGSGQMNPWVGKAGRGVPETNFQPTLFWRLVSLMKFNDIHKYWSSGCFLGHNTFRIIMSRD